MLSISFPQVGFRRQPVSGIAFTLVIALLAMLLAEHSLNQQLGLNAMVYAIIIGMLIGNTIYPKLAQTLDAGINISKGQLLRLGIILYGFRLTFEQVFGLGGAAFLVDALILCSTFTLSYWLGHKLLGLDRTTSVLTGAGCSICGAAAILATAPITKAKSEQITPAVAVIVIFGSLAIVVYPWLQQLFEGVFTAQQFGVVVGSSVHEVAQVVAIGQQLGDTTADTAILTKMVRVMMLAPFLVFVALWFNQKQTTDNQPKASSQFPWFALVFLAVIGFNSIIQLPSQAIVAINQLDNLLLLMAMGALGLTTQLSTLKQAGSKLLILGGVIFIWLIAASLSLTWLFSALF